MLNEVEVLRRSLERYGVPEGQVHPWVKPLRRAKTLVVRLDGGGRVVVVEWLEAEEAARLFKITESAHSNFPGINMGGPVWELDARDEATRRWLEAPKEDVAGRARALREACEGAGLAKEAGIVLKRLRRTCAELKPRFEGEAGEFGAFPALIERVLLTEGVEEEWYRGLTEAMLKASEAGPAGLLEQVEAVLAGKHEEREGRFGKTRDNEKVALLLEVADYRRFGCGVGDARMQGYWSRRLLESEGSTGEEGVCALTGRRMELESDKMPSPRLPVLGDVILMSMNPDTPCQRRYERIGMEVCRVGRETARELNAALVRLSTPDRQYKNWQTVPGVVSGKRNLLLAYLEGSPLDDAEVASLFSEPEEAEENYGGVCERVFRALVGRESYASERVQVLVLNKISPGQVQVELSGAFSAEQVVRGGREWEKGARNRPELVFWVQPAVPFPAEVVRCTQECWIRGGTERTRAPGCGLGEVYDLLIADRAGLRDSAGKILGLVVGRSGALLKAVGHACHRGPEGGQKKGQRGLTRQGWRAASVAVGVLGIGLWRLGIQKERYMAEAAFELGRFLSLVDTLHQQYCVRKRDGQVPPQLLGSALLATAVRSPKKGLAAILRRIGVYQAWARTDGTPLARWVLGQMGEVSAELAKRLPERIDEAGEAQLLLGYLARGEKEAEEESEEEGRE